MVRLPRPIPVEIEVSLDRQADPALAHVFPNDIAYFAEIGNRVERQIRDREQAHPQEQSGDAGLACFQPRLRTAQTM